jgi:hypothetical protein
MGLNIASATLAAAATPVQLLGLIGTPDELTISNGSSATPVFIGTSSSIAAGGGNTAVIPPYGILRLTEVYSNLPLWVVGPTGTYPFQVSAITNERNA